MYTIVVSVVVEQSKGIFTHLSHMSVKQIHFLNMCVTKRANNLANRQLASKLALGAFRFPFKLFTESNDVQC